MRNLPFYIDYCNCEINVLFLQQVQGVCETAIFERAYYVLGIYLSVDGNTIT